MCLIRIPPGRLPSQVFQVHPTSRRLLGDPDHAGGIIHLIWLGKDLGKMLLKMDGPFLNVYRYTQTAKITVGVFVCTCVCLLLLFIQSTYTHTHTQTHTPQSEVSVHRRGSQLAAGAEVTASQHTPFPRVPRGWPRAGTAHCFRRLDETCLRVCVCVCVCE